MGTRSIVTAIALLLATDPGWAQSSAEPPAAGATVALSHQQEIAPGVPALPRLKPRPGIAFERINHALARLDAEARDALKGCSDSGTSTTSGNEGSFGREISIPMAGPNFFTVRLDDDSYCGGPYPNSEVTAITYDLSTGKPVDWVALLGPNLGGAPEIDTKSGKPTGFLISKALFRLWIKARGPSNDAGDNEICKGTPEGATGPLQVWADASEGGGIMVQSMDVVHATAICGRPAMIPARTLRMKGVSAALLDSIAAGKSADLPTH